MVSLAATAAPLLNRKTRPPQFEKQWELLSRYATTSGHSAPRRQRKRRTAAPFQPIEGLDPRNAIPHCKYSPARIHRGPGAVFACPAVRAPVGEPRTKTRPDPLRPVSYTHLTLPTILR